MSEPIIPKNLAASLCNGIGARGALILVVHPNGQHIDVSQALLPQDVKAVALALKDAAETMLKLHDGGKIHVVGS